jgi:hypothetical protein
MPDKIFNNVVRDTKTYKINKKSKVNSKLVLEVINQNKQF